MKHIFSCILVDLTRQYRVSLKDQSKKPDQMKLISSVMAYISDHYTTTTLQEVAEHFHYTSSYLSKYIQKNTGKSFSDLLASFKMEKARQMLLNTSLPLGDIASAVGYSERGYFERMFKRYYSVTPFQYRKMHQERISS